METTAKLRMVRISPQKARLVANQVRSLPIEKAMDILQFSPKKGGRIIKKVVDSAVANAEHNDGADIDELYIKRITVDEGPTYKRHMPRAKGRVNSILKRTSHITVVVSDEQR